MARYERNMLLLAKQEVTAGTDSVPVVGTDAVLIADKIDISPLEATMAERNLMLPYFGGSQSLLASYNSKISFSCEVSGSGTAGTSAPWGDLLLGCGAAEASLTVPTRIETTPASTGLKTLTLYLYDDGVLHKLTGAVGNAKFSAKMGQVPRWSFEMLGSYNAVTAVAFPTGAVLTAWKQPVPMNKVNVVDVTLGCTYATGALTGGTVFPSTGIEVDFGSKFGWVETLKNGGMGQVTDRDSRCSFELELAAAEEVTAMTDMLANTAAGIGFTILGAAGHKLVFFAPQLQRTTIKKTSNNGVRTNTFDGKLVPSAGNDEWRFVQL